MIKGGRIYGEGMKGQVINVISKDSNNFIKILEEMYYQKNKIKNIHLFGITKNKIIDVEEIPKFIEFLKKQPQYIAKIYKKNLLIKSKKSFYNEYYSIKNILKIYKKNINKYTTIHTLNYKNFPFFGINITKKSSTNNKYVMFYTKCKTLDHFTFTDKLLKLFIKNILSSLILLQKHHFSHCDFKPDNFVFCKNTFKIIDWDVSHPIDWNKYHQYYGNTLFTSPFAFYINNVSELIAKNIIYSSNFIRGNYKWINSTIFKTLNEQIKNEFDQILNLKYSRKQLFNYYRGKLDLFNFGLILAFIVFKYKLSFKKYKIFIQKLIAFDSPNLKNSESFMFSNAQAAYHYFIRHF